MMPPAPGRFSTSTGCLKASLMCLATMRPAMSAPEPGVRGTMIRIAFTGYSCAGAAGATMAAARRKAESLAVAFIAPPGSCAASKHDDQKDDREDDDDDEQQVVVGDPAAGGKHVQLAGDHVDFGVAHRADPRLGFIGRDAQRFQLLHDFGALHEGAQLFPIGILNGRFERGGGLVGADQLGFGGTPAQREQQGGEERDGAQTMVHGSSVFGCETPTVPPPCRVARIVTGFESGFACLSAIFPLRAYNAARRGESGPAAGRRPACFRASIRRLARGAPRSCPSPCAAPAPGGTPRLRAATAPRARASTSRAR